VGEKVGCTPQRAYDYETGRRDMGKDTAKKLAGVFSVSPALFI
jgi:hypothetical protein